MKDSNQSCTEEKKEFLEEFDKNFRHDLDLIEKRNQAMAELVAELNESQYKKFEKFLNEDKKVQRSIFRNTLATFLKNKR